MASQRVTLRQVAERSGVSIQSASHILSGRDQRYPAQTQERVRQAARELDYQPNLVGRALARGKTMSVGVVVQGLAGRLETARLWTLLETARDRGYQPYLATSGRNDAGGLVEIVRGLVGRRVDGLIIARSTPISDQARQYLKSLSVPVVFVNWAPPKHKARIAFGAEAGLDQLAVHLAELGHKRGVLFVTRESTDFLEHKIHPYQRSFTRHGIELSIIVEDERPDAPGSGTHWNLEHEHRGYQVVRQYLSARPSRNPATVLCMNNDETALGALAAIREAGLRVPDDLSLVGFNDIAIANYCDPPLTTVRIPRQEVGLAAFEMLHELMQDPTKPVKVVTFPFELIVRQSTAPAVGSDPHPAV